MDGCDFYDYFVAPLLDLSLGDLAKVADYAPGSDWVFVQDGSDDTADKIADVIYSRYVDTCACDVWGPSTYVDWYLDNVLVLNDDQNVVVH